MPGTGYNEMAQGWGFDRTRPWSMHDYPYSGYSYRYDPCRNGDVRVREAIEEGRSSTQRLTPATLGRLGNAPYFDMTLGRWVSHALGHGHWTMPDVWRGHGGSYY
jgi:hypothetical protein